MIEQENWLTVELMLLLLPTVQHKMQLVSSRSDTMFVPNIVHAPADAQVASGDCEISDPSNER